MVEIKYMKNNFFKSLLIIGCGGHAKVVSDIAKCLNILDINYHDFDIEKNIFLDKDVIHKDIKNYDGDFFVAIGDNFLREKVTRNFKTNNPNSKAATLIHPTSVISDNCSIGEGTVIMPQTVVSSFSKIGDGVIINNFASIDHDNNLMNFCSIAPGVVTGGNVSIGFRSAICLGAVIRNKIQIGSDTVIGGASFVNKNISDNNLAYGSPAKIIKKREAFDKYL